MGGETAGDFDVEDYVGTSPGAWASRCSWRSSTSSCITAIATLGAFLYNMAAALLGGIEVTLAEDN